MLKETLDSGGQQRFTDSNGQAFDVLRSREPFPAATSRKVTISANCPVAISENRVEVMVN
jgi:hypothetical protein